MRTAALRPRLVVRLRRRRGARRRDRPTARALRATDGIAFACASARPSLRTTESWGAHRRAWWHRAAVAGSTKLPSSAAPRLRRGGPWRTSVVCRAHRRPDCRQRRRCKRRCCVPTVPQRTRARSRRRASVSRTLNRSRLGHASWASFSATVLGRIPVPYVRMEIPHSGARQKRIHDDRTTGRSGPCGAGPRRSCRHTRSPVSSVTVGATSEDGLKVFSRPLAGPQPAHELRLRRCARAGPHECWCDRK